MNNGYRVDPFTGTFLPEETVEYHTVQLWDDINKYGIRTNEVALSGYPVIITVSGETTAFVEVGSGDIVNSGEYKVDYETITKDGTNFIEFNFLDDQTNVRVSFSGCGLAISQIYVNNYYKDDFTVSGKLFIHDVYYNGISLTDTMGRL